MRVSGNSSSNDPNAKFTDFMRRLVQVPHSEIKAKLDAERKAKQKPKRASRVPASSSKAR
jgi:hypothetical protein